MLKPNEASDKGVVDAHKRGKGSWGPPMRKLVVGGTNFESTSKSSQIDLKALEEDEVKLKEERKAFDTDKEKAGKDFKAHTDNVVESLTKDRKAFEDEKAKNIKAFADDKAKLAKDRQALEDEKAKLAKPEEDNKTATPNKT